MELTQLRPLLTASVPISEQSSKTGVTGVQKDKDGGRDCTRQVSEIQRRTKEEGQGMYLSIFELRNYYRIYRSLYTYEKLLFRSLLELDNNPSPAYCK